MNKKEVSEIKKQFRPDQCAISRICGCYVDHDEHETIKRMVSSSSFLTLPEEEIFKYLEIFKQTLSGTIGKNLNNIEFPLSEEATGGKQEFLLKLRDSKLTDDSLVELFFDKVIETFDYPENYYMILIHSTYDIPGKTLDDLELFDSSDEVYEHLLFSICPVNRAKAGLSYNPGTNSIEKRNRDWVVEAPMKGFLFPAFSDRRPDIHNLLYFSKNAEDPKDSFIDQLLGCSLPLTPKTQKEAFNQILTDALGDDGDYEMMKNIQDNLTELLETEKDNPEPPVLTKPVLRNILESSGVPKEHMESFDHSYQDACGDNKQQFLAANIASPRQVQISVPDISIKVHPSKMDLIESKLIEGRQCLVITVDDHVEINGVRVRTMPVPQEIEHASKNPEEASVDITTGEIIE